jgi:CDP-glycerol glycerophosphotransferase (TagB/SpsB family)
MRGELAAYYPESSGATTSVVGVPHFDWYRDPSMTETREAFCTRHGFDPRRPLVTYAGATPHLAPCEHLLVARLDSALSSQEVPGKPQLLVRLHPGDAGRRYHALEMSHDVRLVTPGRRGDGSLQAFCPTLEENRDLVGSIVHADVVINLASTITLEAALCDRPVINVAFDPDPRQTFRTKIERYYRDYDHYRSVLACGAVRLAASFDELLHHLRTYLTDPALEADGRRRLSALWCGPADGRASQRMVKALGAQLEAASRD